MGWKKADEIALRADGDIYGVNRIKAYIKYCLENKANDGFSYISTDTLMDELVANLGEEIPDLKIAEAIHDLGEDELWWDEKKENIGLRKYYNLEKHIAEELIRLRDAENKFKYDGWEETIKHIQQVQGWEYTEQQYKGIETVLKNNVTVITGYGGTGKSSIAKGMLQILNHYSSALCALSGKAAVRLAEVSGQQGSTIHSLLAYPSPQDEIAKTRQNFGYNDINQLPQDIIIVDEGSMIDARLYYYLLRSIQTGSKLVILGDAGQLEPIGNGNVFADLIKSDEIPVVVLDKIHRQAAKSGIITDSIKLRKGIQILDKDETGEFIHGELKDFVIDAFSDSSNTYYEVLKYFQKELAEVGNIMDVQILSPVKTRGSACTWELNNALQELYNPKADNKKEIAVKYGKDRIGILREGDKVICTKNNRKLFNMDTEEICTVFNGNMGIIRSISSDQESIIVDFENIGGVYISIDFFINIELGMAISAHKSQGSQWKRVIVAIDFSAYALLTRELVYTAVTRAEEKNILVCQTSALRYAIGNERISIKLTHLPKLLYEVAHPVMKF